MNLLITGAAGNLGSHLARHFIEQNRSASQPHQLKLLIHHRELPQDITEAPNVTVYKADLSRPETLTEACRNTDCIIHFAGILFAPQPAKFLPQTNTQYLKNIVDVALELGVKKFILVSFPHVEGESTPDHPAKGIMPTKEPDSAHARTRVAAEIYLFEAAKGTRMTPIALRPGMIYARDILMIDAARWMSQRHMLAVWRRPTWIHLISLPDFLTCCQAAIEKEDAEGIYNLGDDSPTTLQEFLDRAAGHWGYRKPWRAPEPLFYLAAGLTELFAAIFKTRAPITRDFIRIGMASYVMDTSRMRQELLPSLRYPTSEEGLVLL